MTTAKKRNLYEDIREGLEAYRDHRDTLPRRKLLRRIAQHHLEAGKLSEISPATADAALHEMLFSGSVLNKRLLGGEAVQQ